MANNTERSGYSENIQRPDDDIRTPLSKRVSKMEPGLGKEALKSAAFLGDAAYTFGRMGVKAVLNKISGKNK